MKDKIRTGVPSTEGYQPSGIENNGYQPSSPQYIPSGDPRPQSGYQPTSSGTNPTNIPSPPGDE